ncbi:MAG TPA: secondary thiamine-phosphate synthase enzyme YjbQ [Candidatus Acidoferrales bacterium]|nr:secondary thiamine-phosphate synthase enzyme YjbQ [Candidatus Acidoferrales bacterium]
MNIYTEHLTFHSKQKREIINITEQVRAALQKCGFHDGFAIVSALHSNSAVFVNDAEPGLLDDITAWLDRLCPPSDAYKHKGTVESSSEKHLQTMLLSHTEIIGFTEGKLELGPWQFIQYAELDGLRPKRVLIKIIGE